MRHYRRRDWSKFRNEVIELDGHACVRCRRRLADGVVLQVHHKKYLPGKLPWEYPYDQCETLCKGCHAGEHGIIRPFTGWVCVGYEDLDDLVGECEVCGNALRHVFFVQHEKWPSLEVGETCCDHLTDTKEASDHMDSLRRFESRRERFIQSSRWRIEAGIHCVRQKGADLSIELIEKAFRLRINDVAGKKRFPSVHDAKSFAFSLFESGEIEAFLAKQERHRRR